MKLTRRKLFGWLAAAGAAIIAGPRLPMPVAAALAWSDPAPEVKPRPFLDGYYHMTNPIVRDPLPELEQILQTTGCGRTPEGDREVEEMKHIILNEDLPQAIVVSSDEMDRVSDPDPDPTSDPDYYLNNPKWGFVSWKYAVGDKHYGDWLPVADHEVDATVEHVAPEFARHHYREVIAANGLVGLMTDLQIRKRPKGYEQDWTEMDRWKREVYRFWMSK